MTDTIYFTTARNYMKRDSSSGTTSIAAPVTSAFSGYLYTTTYTVYHNLGFIPVFRVYYEPFGDGVIWPPMGSRLGQRVANPLNTSAYGPGLITSATASQVNIQIFYSTNTLTGTFPIYWVIYKDYQI